MIPTRRMEPELDVSGFIIGELELLPYTLYALGLYRSFVLI